MLNKYWRISLILVLIFLWTFFLFSPVWANTLLEKKDNNNYEIKVKIVFDFQESAKAKANDLLNLWLQGMDQVWNGNFLRANFQNDILVKYKFDLKPMAAGKKCADYPDYHCFSVVDRKLNQRGNIADSMRIAFNSWQNSIGEWTTATTNLNAAHEVGHLLGLKDEYHYIDDLRHPLILHDLNSLGTNGSFWAAYDANNLALAQKNNQNYLSFAINPEKSQKNFAEIGNTNLQPISILGYEDGYLETQVYLPEIANINFVTLYLGSYDGQGQWQDVLTDWQGKPFVKGWNKLQIKLKQMKIKNEGLNFSALNTIIARITYTEELKGLVDVRFSPFILYKKNKKWINDNYQPSETQSIMAQTWEKVAALPEHTNKILTLIK